jgi:hypothetical protein
MAVGRAINISLLPSVRCSGMISSTLKISCQKTKWRRGPEEYFALARIGILRLGRGLGSATPSAGNAVSQESELEANGSTGWIVARHWCDGLGPKMISEQEAGQAKGAVK